MAAADPRRSRRPRRSVAALALLVLAVLVAACGDDSTEASSSGDGGSSGDEVVLKIKDPGNAGVLAYAKREGVLEDALADVGATVEWGGNYASFTDTVEAVRAGEVNVLGGAISPALGYFANGDGDLRIISLTDPQEQEVEIPNSGLIVPADSDADSIEDLVGKKVAVNQAGKGEYMLLLALEEAGIPVDEVERVYLQPDQAASAFQAGHVDAWWAITQPGRQAIANGAKVLVTEQDLPSDDFGMTAAKADLVEEHPEVLAVYLDVVADLTEQQQQEPELFQNVFETSGPTATEGERLEQDIADARLAVVPRAPQPEDIERVQAVADFFTEHGVIPAELDATEIVVNVQDQETEQGS